MPWQNQVTVVLQAGNTIINPNGNFIYNGTPGPGNLMIALAPAAGTDAYGNTYPQGISVAQSGLFLYSP